MISLDKSVERVGYSKSKESLNYKADRFRV